MTRTFARVFVTLALVALAAAPIWAAPLGLARDATIRAHAPSRSHAPGLVELLLTAPIVFGAIRVKDLGTVAKKFVRNAQAASGDFVEGAKAGAQDWESNTAASEDNYAAGVQAGINRKAFGKGVRAAGAGKYLAKVVQVGADRFRTGIGAAEAEFSKGMGPVLQTIAGITLPPRRPKGDPANMERANVVASTLRRMKTGQA